MNKTWRQEDGTCTFCGIQLPVQWWIAGYITKDIAACMKLTRPLKLCDFASDITEGLIECKAKIRRPLVSSPPVKPPTNRPTKRPAVVIRKDGTNHLPIWDEKRQRCKLGGCDGFSYIKCCRCNMHLCLNKDRNCFVTFHF